MRICILAFLSAIECVLNLLTTIFAPPSQIMSLSVPFCFSFVTYEIMLQELNTQSNTDKEHNVKKTVDKIIEDHAEAEKVREQLIGYLGGFMDFSIETHKDKTRVDFEFENNATVVTTEVQSSLVDNNASGQHTHLTDPAKGHLEMNMQMMQLQVVLKKEETTQLDLQIQGMRIEATMEGQRIEAGLKKTEMKTDLKRQKLILREKEINAQLELARLQTPVVEPAVSTTTAKPRTRAKKEASTLECSRPAKKQFVNVINPSSKDAKPGELMQCIIAEGTYQPWTDLRTREQILQAISEAKPQELDKNDAGPCGEDAHRVTVCRLLWPKTYNRHLDLIESASAGPKGFPRSLTQCVVRSMLQKRQPNGDTMTPTTNVDVLRAAIYLGTEFVDLAKKLSPAHSPCRFRMKRVGDEEVPIVYTTLLQNHPFVPELADWLVDPEERCMPSLLHTGGPLPEGLEDLESDGEILRRWMPKLRLPRATSTVGRIRDRLVVQAYECIASNKVDLPTLAETLNWPTVLQECQAQRAILAVHHAIRARSPAASEVSDLRRAAIVIYSAILSTDTMNRGSVLQAIVDKSKEHH